ncbi:MAG TPA: hypothetical protein VMA09_15375 [Candidatus Binataceae bacterium]|nr:hypothetical protein [Candidatus Binataceae bacterium]
MKKILLMVAAGLMLLAPVASFAQDSGKPDRAEMVRRIQAACVGKNEGAQCNFTRGNGDTANGTCMNRAVRKEDVLFCITPQMMKRMNEGGGGNQ